MAIGLPVSRLISVGVILTPAGAQTLNFDSLLILGDSDVINGLDRIRSYGSLTEVAGDFGTTAPEYYSAELFFDQTPEPTQVYIGRWIESPTAAILTCGPLTAAQQQISNWTSITAGSFKIAQQGGDVTNIPSLNFSSESNLNGVASAIETALTTAGLTGMTCVWNGSQFIFTSGTTGSSSSVSYLTAGASNDISAQLMGTAALAEENAPGYAAETALAAVVACDDLATQWYGFTTACGVNNADITDADNLAIAAYIEASGIGTGNPHINGVTTSEAAALSPSDNSSIGYQFHALGYNRTFTQYSSENAFATASWYGRAFTVDFNAQNSTITMAYKQEPGVIAESLSSTSADSLDGNFYNYYASFNNGTAIIVNGWMASGVFFDTIWGVDWLANTIQTNVFDLLYESPKVPQTDPGTQLIVNEINAANAAGVNNGLIAPGIWNATGFGTLVQGANLPLGYYCYAPPVATQSEEARAARKSVAIQDAVKLAGAIQDVAISVYVNQ